MFVKGLKIKTAQVPNLINISLRLLPVYTAFLRDRQIKPHTVTKMKS